MITGCAQNSTSSRGTRLLSAQWTPQAALLQRSLTLRGSMSKWVTRQTCTYKIKLADISCILIQVKATATVANIDSYLYHFMSCFLHACSWIFLLTCGEYISSQSVFLLPWIPVLRCVPSSWSWFSKIRWSTYLKSVVIKETNGKLSWKICRQSMLRCLPV